MPITIGLTGFTDDELAQLLPLLSGQTVYAKRHRGFAPDTQADMKAFVSDIPTLFNKRPNVLIADGDPTTFERLARCAARQGVPVVFCGHDLSEEDLKPLLKNALCVIASDFHSTAQTALTLGEKAKKNEIPCLPSSYGLFSLASKPSSTPTNAL